ncbi:MAG: isochorismatase family protein [Planctomycetaceae bacterium]
MTRTVPYAICNVLLVVASCAADEPRQRTVRPYRNQLLRVTSPRPILADHPEFVAPVREAVRYEAPPLILDKDADLDVRAWRFSYNARGIIEVPNRLRAQNTAVIVVHPWGIDDGQGWKTPEPAGVCDFCTPTKNHLAARHTRHVINPFLKSLRSQVGMVLYSMRGPLDPLRRRLYRSTEYRPSTAERTAAKAQLSKVLASFSYRGDNLPATLMIDTRHPVRSYFEQFPGLDAGARYNNTGFWDLPVPVTSDIDVFPDDVVVYDQQKYPVLKRFLQDHGIRHVLLTGYATDMCYCSTTAGYENLSQDFNVFLVGDATLATFPANSDPSHATNAAIAFASLQQFITQISWIQLTSTKQTTQAHPAN